MTLFIYTECYNLQSILMNIILVDLNRYMKQAIYFFYNHLDSEGKESAL